MLLISRISASLNQVPHKDACPMSFIRLNKFAVTIHLI